MNGAARWGGAVLAALALAGCAPDLVVEGLTVDWTGANRTAEATIRNAGGQSAGGFLVYFNGDEFPESRGHRPQVSHRVPALAAGASIVLQADFAPLAHPDNLNLANVYQITVLADPKSDVAESNEGNNRDRLPTAAAAIDLRDRNDAMVPPSPPLLGQTRQPLLFVHGHDAMGVGFNYRRNWQDPLDYGALLRLPSFAIAIAHNAALAVEPYYLNLVTQDRSVSEDAAAIGEAVTRILARHGDPAAAQVKVSILAYSKGTISSRWYLRNMMPAKRPVSELIAIAPPNHGLGAGGALTGPSLALRQLNNGYDDQCVSFNEAESLDFIERLNGHPITDTTADPPQGAPHAGEAPESRADGTPVGPGVLYVTLYADGNRDLVGGSSSSGDCQGRLVARNLAADAVNLEVPEIVGVTAAGVHVNTVHTPEVICLGLYAAVHHQAPPAGFACAMQTVDGRRVPVVPVP